MRSGMSSPHHAPWQGHDQLTEIIRVRPLDFAKNQIRDAHFRHCHQARIGGPMRRDSGTRNINEVQAIGCIVLAALCAASPASTQPVKEERVVIEYVAPAHPGHKPLYDELKQHRTLELVRDLLAPVRWPQPLRLELKGCDGESNAWYQDAAITVCYEYVEDIWRSANSPARPPATAREDAFVGPLADVFLHEASHALFDMLRIPLLGREEDAADQLAAYHVLQLPRDLRRKLIAGTAWAYASELKVRRPRDLQRRRLEITRHVTLADEHGTPAQRLYNLLCIAYGSDKELFADAVEKGLLPQERAEICEDEYRQVDFAYRTLIAPHVDARR
jgi:Putative metallopeptidase